jgi:uncharacterized protein YbjQ (UPF0145 family)
MLITTSDTIPGKNIEALGLVQGNVVTSTHIGRDLMANLKTIVGGEVKQYTEMTNNARQMAEERMVDQATAMGADAVVAFRFGGESVLQGTSEFMAYGTAVKYI